MSFNGESIRRPELKEASQEELKDAHQQLGTHDVGKRYYELLINNGVTQLDAAIRSAELVSRQPSTSEAIQAKLNNARSMGLITERSHTREAGESLKGS